jgi:flagellin-specific chaperone FliS
MQKYYEAKEFRKQKVIGASPMRLVLMAYDLAIFACERRDFDRATKAVSVLRDALGYDYGDIAVGLFSLYQWCLDCIRKEDYNDAVKTLRELREAWAIAENKLSTLSQKDEGGGINSASERDA